MNKLELPLRYLVDFYNKREQLNEEERKSITRIYDNDIHYSLSRRDLQNDSIEIEAEYLCLSLAEKLLVLCEGRGRCHDKGRKYLSTFLALSKNPSSGKLSQLTAFPKAFDAYFKETFNMMICVKEGRQEFNNFYIYSSCTYQRKTEYQSAHISVSFKGLRYGEETTYSFNVFNLGKDGLSVSEILNINKVVVVDEELFKEYDENCRKFIALRAKIGKLYHGEGYNESVSWKDSSTSMVVEGETERLVIDTPDDDKWYKVKNMTNRFYSEENTNELDFKSRENLEIPMQFYLRTYSIKSHKQVYTHMENLTEYIYNPQLIDKLVLEESHKELIKVLSKSDTSVMEDIIEGKIGGIFVLCTGEPGLGKTLTAEVLSEFVQAPLYKVQCSQLGLDVDKIESNLENVLRRSKRWGAVLLIDEADVYIRKRGTDIHQNAIVGVFLRLIEYYKGILFMTSNLGQDIDDAIKSRAIAQIDYNYPNLEDRIKIISIMIQQMNLKVIDKPEVIADSLGELSGRDIKNIFKLAKIISDKTEKPADIKSLLMCKSYIKK